MFHFRSSYPCLAIITIICFLARLRGDRALKTGAWALLIASYTSELVQDWNGAHKSQPFIFLIDIAYGALLTVLVYRTPARWPQAAAVAQALLITLHLGALLGPEVSRWDFFAAYYVVSYLGVGALAYGAVVESPRRRGREPVAILRP